MSLDWVRQQYDVPAKRGMRIRYTGAKEPQFGTITGAENGHVMIKIDGQRHSNPYHPTWELEYNPEIIA